MAKDYTDDCKKSFNRGIAAIKELSAKLKAKLPYCPSITVHPSNEAPVYALHVTLDEEKLRKVAALIAALG